MHKEAQEQFDQQASYLLSRIMGWIMIGLVVLICGWVLVRGIMRNGF